MTFSREQCRAARALLGWTQEQLEEATVSAGAKVAKKTIADFEAGNRTPYGRTLADIRRALEAAGILFLSENGEGPGVRLRKDSGDKSRA
jgi:transcriptional regulator with XRE-family HTH domain